MGGWTQKRALLSVSVYLLVTHSRVAGGIKVKGAWQKSREAIMTRRGAVQGKELKKYYVKENDVI